MGGALEASRSIRARAADIAAQHTHADVATSAAAAAGTDGLKHEAVVATGVCPPIMFLTCYSPENYTQKSRIPWNIIEDSATRSGETLCRS